MADDGATSLSSVIRSLRGMYFTSTKLSVLEALLYANTLTQAVATSFGGFGGSPAFRGPHVTINRMRAATVKETSSSTAAGGATGTVSGAETVCL